MFQLNPNTTGRVESGEHVRAQSQRSLWGTALSNHRKAASVENRSADSPHTGPRELWKTCFMLPKQEGSTVQCHSGPLLPKDGWTKRVKQ